MKNKTIYILLTTLGLSLPAFSTTVTWDGNPNNNWRNDSNWSNGGSPGATDSAIFPDDSNKNDVDLSNSNNNDVDRLVNEVLFETDGTEGTTVGGPFVNWNFKNGRLAPTWVGWESNAPDADDTILVRGTVLINSGTSCQFAGSAGTHYLDWDGDIQGAGTLSLDTVAGNNRLIINDPLSFTGTVDLKAGALYIRHASALANATVKLSGGSWNYAGYSPTIKSLTGSGNAALLNGKILTVGTSSSSSFTYNGVLSGLGHLKINLPASQTMTLTADQTYSGVTEIDRGILKLTSASLASSPVNVDGGTLTINGTSTIGNLSGAGTVRILSASGTLTGTPSTLKIKGSTFLSPQFTGTLSGGGTFVHEAGTLEITGTSGDFSGEVITTGGILRTGSTRFVNSVVTISADGSLELLSSTEIRTLAGSGDLALDYNLGLVDDESDASYSGDLTGNGSLSKHGVDTWTYNGTKSGTGTVAINDGTLAGNGTFFGNTTIAVAATLAPGLETMTFGNQLSLGGDLDLTIDGTSHGKLVCSGLLTRASGNTRFGKLNLTASGSGFTESVYIIATYGNIASLGFDNVTGLPAGYSIDYAYNDGTSSKNIALVDIIAPTLDSLALDGSLSSPTAASTLLFNISFSEAVTGVDANDFLIDFPGINPATLTGSGATYTLTIPNVIGEATLTVSLPDGNGIVDGSGNDLETTSLSASVVVDTIAPQVSITTTTSSPTTAETIIYTCVFTEPVFGFDDDSDFYFTSAHQATVIQEDATVMNSGDNQTFTLTINSISGDGPLQYRLNGRHITDAVGNGVIISTAQPSDPYGPTLTIDNTAPTVLSISPNESGPIASSSLSFTVDFSESVTSFDAFADLEVITTLTATATDATFAGSGSNYVVTLTGVAGAGELALAVKTDTGVMDLVGHTLESSVTSAGVQIVEFLTLGDFEYRFINTNTEVEITGYTGTATHVVCPHIIEGKLVTRIGIEAFWGNTTIETILLPSGLLTIDQGAFSSCTSLTAIESSSVTTLESAAFSGCTSLTEVTLPSVVTIGGNAFTRCTSLVSISLPASLTFIQESALNECTSLESIEVDPNNGFYSSSNGVLFNAAQTRLVRYPLAKTESEYSIPLPVQSLGSSSFRDCVNLSLLQFPASLISFGSGQLENCTALEQIDVDTGNSVYMSFDGVVFNKAGTALTFCPEGKTGSFSVPSGVLTIDGSAFEKSSLSAITLPEGLTEIKTGVFREARDLTDITLPVTLTSIGSSAFQNCTSLTDLTFPASLTSIGLFAFEAANQLVPLFLGNAPAAGSAIFNNTSFTTVYYLEGATGFGATWKGKITVALDANTTPWLLDNGYAFDTDLLTDPNGDGVDLLTAYALDLDPTTNLSGSLPAGEIDSTSNTFSISYYAAAAGITYTVETTGALEANSWTTNGINHSALDTNSMQTASVPLSPTNGFLRLEIEN